MKDKNSIYSNGKKLEGVDIQTFRKLNEYYAVDKNNIYYNLNSDSDIKRIKNTDGNFKIIEEKLIKNKDGVYYLGEKIKEIDPNSFKIIRKNNLKKDISLILCVIYFSYLIFKIFIQKEIVRTDNSILKTIYFFRIDKLLFCAPIFYYFIKTNKENKYFKVNKKLNITDFITYFALIFYINIFLNLIISFVIYSTETYTYRYNLCNMYSTYFRRNCISWCSDDIFEKIWN